MLFSTLKTLPQNARCDHTTASINVASEKFLTISLQKHIRKMLTEFLDHRNLNYMTTAANMDKHAATDKDVESLFWDLVTKYRKLARSKGTDIGPSIFSTHMILAGWSRMSYSPKQMSRAVRIAAEDLSDNLAKLETRFTEFQHVQCQYFLGKVTRRDCEVAWNGLEAALNALFVVGNGANDSGCELLRDTLDVFLDDRSVHETLMEPHVRLRAHLATLRDLDRLLSKEALPESWTRECSYLPYRG